MLLNAVKGHRPSEFSQRSRAFLFSSLAAIATHLCGAREIRLCDNGVVSLNLPPSGQCIGTTLSRSTHPAFLRHLETFLRLVLEDASLKVTNTLIFRTKREVVQMVSRLGKPDMIQETVSCAHTEGKTRGQPHCGTCTQCIDRRFATIAAGVAEHDLVGRYEADIFTTPLKDGQDRTHAENYVRFAQELGTYDNASAFAVARLPDLTLALPDSGLDEYIQSVYELLQRHQADVHRVLEVMVRAHASDIARGSLSPHCLLSILGAVGAAPGPQRAFVTRLGDILVDSIPAAFRSQKPTSEAQMQDVGEAALRAAGERLTREAPQTPFGTVSVRPDFSRELPGEHSLYVEFKLVKHRRDVGRTHGQIAQDLVQYPAECWILFVVYDPTSAIRDPVAFSNEFAIRRERVVVRVIR
ncbi:MAG: 7-cyano-7-deazaguanine synthase [Gemmatimonadaceae bacterium]|nr:7-cyano-7-deazaguanine synthase [Gemmatimonadaceae bacterium]